MGYVGPHWCWTGTLISIVLFLFLFLLLCGGDFLTNTIGEGEGWKVGKEEGKKVGCILKLQQHSFGVLL